jgi:hypothetical protein
MKNTLIFLFIFVLFFKTSFSNAPESIVGFSITFSEADGEETSSYGADGKSHDSWGSTGFTYEKLSEDTGKISYEYSTTPEVETLTFTSVNGGTFSWVEYTDATQQTIKEEGTGTFMISQDEEYALESVVGYSITFSEPEGEETSSYGSDGKSYDNMGFTDFRYEKLTANTGRISYEENTAPEIETLTFTSATGGTFAWVEYADTNRENIVDEGTGTFTLSATSYTPSSLSGKTIYIPEEGHEANYYFTEDGAYYVIPPPGNREEGIPYSYVANTSTTATLTLARETGDVIHQISFSSPTTADSNWTDLESNETDSAELKILTEDHWPSTLAGWSYQGTSMNDTFYFVDEGHAVFYDASDSNFSNRELSNITYTWEQIGPRIGKLTTSLDEETLLFFESNTSGFFDWEEIGSDAGSSGQFDLFYYPLGKAFESLVGSSISIGDTTYVFTSTNAVTMHSPSGTSSQEYAYLRENEDEGLLSLGSSLYKLDFYNHQYGRIIEGGSGYFSIHQNWATKGWVYYNELPWIYSNNKGEWLYQVLSNNNATNETELMYYDPWDKVVSQDLDLNYTDQRVFSADTQFYWEDYDDFSGSELNSSKWDVGYWGGGQAVTINDGKAHLSGEDFSSNAPIQMPSDLVAAALDSTEGNTFLFFKNEDIYGIQADISIPSQNNEYKTGVYLASLDTNPLGSLGVELRYKTSGPVLLFDYLYSGNEFEHQETGSLDTFYQLQITKLDGNTSHYLNGNLIKQFESSSHDEDYWTIGAFNDAGKPYTTYADNIRVLRKKSYPQGWMWTNYYPWAYSYETGGWLYFELAKDSDGKPVMNYYDHNSGSWDLYGPSLNQFYDR